MQLALATFDPSGDGRFNREEWEAGLRHLGWEGLDTYDVQEVFTVLDKRQHHVLTLSDLIDRYNGLDINIGLPLPGLQHVAANLLAEVLDDEFKSIIAEVMAETIGQELLAPRGMPDQLPDLDEWLDKRKKEQLRLQEERERREKEQQQQQQSLALSQKKEKPGRRRKSSRNVSKENSKAELDDTAELSMGLEHSFSSTGGEESAAGSPGSRKKHGRKGKLDSLEGSPSVSPTESEGRKKRVKAKLSQAHAVSDLLAEMGGQEERSDRKRRPKKRGGLPDEPSVSVTTAPSRHMRSKEGRSRHSRSSQMRSQSESSKKFAGFSFADSDEIASASQEKLLPWMPRPTEEICKTYNHIFRLLSDPRVKRLQAGPQKRSVKVSMPQMPNVPMMSQEDADSDLVSDEEEADIFDQQAPLPSKMRATKGGWGSKSTPMMATGASTTAGTWRPGSGGTLGDSGYEGLGSSGASTGSLLPPLANTSPGVARRWAGAHERNSGIDANRARPPEILLAGGPLNGTM